MYSPVAPRPARAIALLLLVAAIAAGGCSQRRPVGPAGAEAELPDQEINDFSLTETDAGKPLWKLNARYAAEYSARNQILARTLRVDFFDDTGARSSVLTAREGEINSRTRDMVARGHVVLETSEGSRLSTEQLLFLNRDQKILVPEDQLVRVQHEHDVLTGYGFESDPNLSHYEFKRRIEATVRSRVPIDEESR
jgi:LPS export ABC transporter protein LptC